MLYRTIGKRYLKKFTDSKNIKNLENLIYMKTKDENSYNRLIYEIIGDIINKKDINNIIKDINDNLFFWNNNIYDDIKNVINEQNDFIENPFEVDEGVIECNCGSKRVFSYSKQTRGADEPMTTFAQCMSCKKSWSYSG